MRRSWAIALTIALATSLVALPRASADPYASAMTRGAVARERATESHDPRDWDDALRAFTEADQARPTKESKFELARAAAELHEDDLAVQSYEAAIEAGIIGKAKEIADAFVASHAPSMGRIFVDGDEGTSITLRGRARGVLPLERAIVVFSGDAELVLRARDGLEQRMTVKTTAGQTVRVVVPSAPMPRAWDEPATASSTTVGSMSAPTARPITAASSTPSTTASTSSAAPAAWPRVLVGGGIPLFALGAAGTLGWSLSIASHRSSLGRTCLTGRVGDACPNPGTFPSQAAYDAAQSDVNDIATGKALRIASIVVGGVGLGAAIVGLVDIVGTRAGSPTERRAPIAASLRPIATPLPGGGFFGLVGAF